MLISKGCELNVQEQSCLLSGSPDCPTGCNQDGVQSLEISQAVILTPTTQVGPITTTCQGRPTICCAADAAGTSCTVTLTQRVCVTIPVKYSVDMTKGDPVIACSGECCGC